LHNVGSSNPLQHYTADKKPFHPYFTSKDSFILSVALTIFFVIVCFYPNLLGHPDNFIPANPLVTPAHIVPEWYFTPFYAILRACPDKLGGVISMACAILILFILPVFKTTPNSMPTNSTYIYPTLYWLFVSNFMILMFLGGQPATAPFVISSKIFTFTYFLYLFFSIPLLNFINYCSSNDVVTFLKKNKHNTFSQKKSIGARGDNYTKCYLASSMLVQTQLPFNSIRIYIQKTRLK